MRLAGEDREGVVALAANRYLRALKVAWAAYKTPDDCAAYRRAIAAAARTYNATVDALRAKP